MRTTRARLGLVLYLTALFWALVVPAAHAYIDPGSGSLVFQAIVGSAMAGALAIKMGWRRIRNVFKGPRVEDRD
jgi:hypothetical protein